MLVRTVRSGTRPPAREPARSVVHHPAVLRRIAAVVVLAGLGSLPCVLLAPAATASPVAALGAVRLVSPEGSRLSGRWQAWANRPRVPAGAGGGPLACPDGDRARRPARDQLPRPSEGRGLRLHQPAARDLHQAGADGL